MKAPLDQLRASCPPAYVAAVVVGGVATAALIGASIVLRPFSRKASDAVENLGNLVNTAGLWPRR